MILIKYCRVLKMVVIYLGDKLICLNMVIVFEKEINFYLKEYSCII